MDTREDMYVLYGKGRKECIHSEGLKMERAQAYKSCLNNISIYAWMVHELEIDVDVLYKVTNFSISIVTTNSKANSCLCKCTYCVHKRLNKSSTLFEVEKAKSSGSL